MKVHVVRVWNQDGCKFDCNAFYTCFDCAIHLNRICSFQVLLQVTSVEIDVKMLIALHALTTASMVECAMLIWESHSACALSSQGTQETGEWDASGTFRGCNLSWFLQVFTVVLDCMRVLK